MSDLDCYDFGGEIVKNIIVSPIFAFCGKGFNKEAFFI
jgi:hypothetical protein